MIGIYLQTHVHMCFVYLLTVMEKRFYSSFFEEKHHNQSIVKEKTRGPRATGRSPEQHSYCRYADVMQHFFNPVIPTNEKIII